ncbi:MAG TPA: ABC transporter permease [Bryobacteraceae bacterium]|jgi:putative ABC transport system permease protein|nr:ABC transporter permease [Bryobacteraceae bacterium]
MNQQATAAARAPVVERLVEPESATFAHSLETFFQDLRYAFRVLYNKPGFASIAIATLALGIGANTAIFSVVNAAILTPIAVPEPNRVAMVWTDKINGQLTSLPASVPDFLDWRAAGVFQKLAGFSTDGYNLLIGNKPERISGVAVTKEWFEISQAQPRLGRVFRGQDMQPGHDQVVLLSYNLWNSRFNADPEIIGKTIIVNGSPRAVIGVLPKRIARLADEEVYVPLVFEGPESTNRGMRDMEAVGRLAPGFSLRSAQGAISGLSARLRQQFPHENGGYQTRLQPIEEAYVQDVHSLVLVLFGAVGFVLLVACANIANLLLVRGAARQKEIAIRSALGAGKFRLMRQLLTESVLLAALGGLVGIVPAFFGIHFITKFKLQALPNADLVALSPKVLFFTLLLALATGVLFGMIPAWDAWRSNAASPLRERSQTSGGRLKFSNLFVVAEVAITVMLVAGAVLMLRSFMQLRAAYPGYDSRVLTMRLSLTGQQYASPETQIQIYKQLEQRLSGLPGVRSVGAIDCLPTCTDTIGATLHFTDRPDPPESDPALAVMGSVTPDYLRTMGIPLVRGRYFSEADGEHDPLSVIIDEGTARRFWPHADPIGKTIKLRMKWPPRKIVGVVGNIDRSLAVKMNSRIGQVYVPAAQMPQADMSLAISSPLGPASLVPSVRREISALVPDQPVFQVETMAQARAGTQMSSEFGTWLLGFFAVLSLLLAAVGVYGVISYTVQQRTREIGVRMAIGASPSDLLFGVLGKGLKLTLFGLVLGSIGAWLLGATMKDLLHGVSSSDPVSLLATMLLLAIVGLLATFIPAYRASRIPPVIALRYE